MRRPTILFLLAALAAIGAVGCGSGSQAPTPLAISISEAGGEASFDAPKSTEGGLVEITFENKGNTPHSVQLALLKGDHSIEEGLKIIQGNSPKTPEWLRAEGGVGTTAPGQTATSILNLPAGTYALTELGGPGLTGAPATGSLEVTAGDDGNLPSTPATVTAAETGKDRFAWEISGLKAGENELTFKSEGDKSLHLIAAYRLKDGQDPSLAEIEKSFSSPKPPAFAELETVIQSPVLDGGDSQTTTLDLKKGVYVFFCPLTDRDGGKPHFEEGLLKKVEIK
jgi:hypothetical protein